MSKNLNRDAWGLLWQVCGADAELLQHAVRLRLLSVDQLIAQADGEYPPALIDLLRLIALRPDARDLIAELNALVESKETAEQRWRNSALAAKTA